MTNTERHDLTIFGFWLYIMSDCLLFASLFATFAVLRLNTAAGPDAHAIFSLPFTLLETLVLLTSSMTAGISLISANSGKRVHTSLWLTVTALLGLAFLGLELHEFASLIKEGASWQISAFLSAFFALVGTHGLHVALGLVWALVLMAQLYRKGVDPATNRRLACFVLFWHFLDIIWIFIFSFVYILPLIS